jgi:hypothetical protein
MVAVKMGLLESIYTLNERDLQLGHERVYDMDLLKAHPQNQPLRLLKSSISKFMPQGKKA